MALQETDAQAYSLSLRGVVRGGFCILMRQERKNVIWSRYYLIRKLQKIIETCNQVTSFLSFPLFLLRTITTNSNQELRIRISAMGHS